MEPNGDGIHAGTLNEIVLLGSGGWIPTSRRATCSALVRAGDQALVLDAGTGIARLVEEADLLAGATTLDVVLTHFHLDHVVGLAYLPALEGMKRLRIFGPGEWLYGMPTPTILERLIGPPFFAVELSSAVSVVEEITDTGLSVGDIELRVRRQSRHSDPTLALRVGDDLAYCTDTAYDEGNVEFARGARLLAHEAWWTEDAPRDESAHSSAREAAVLARDAGVGGFVMIHVRPGADEARLEAEAREVFDGAELGSDLLRLK
jgi:ribonuclease BN (tRNA processing enzyme)